ncbi:MAG: hypothetical protein KJ667_05685 [Alphaproteobacteria bacterium]|nr:hypothetical protein [Alphaproteobacteria bacterium]
MMRSNFDLCRTVICALMMALFLCALNANAMAQNVPAPRAQKERFPSMQHVFDQLPADMQDELMEEVQQASNLCTAYALFATYQDCQCIGVKYLDARLAMGPDVPMNNLLHYVGAECTNKPAIAGYQFELCQERMKFGGADMSPEESADFCKCVGNNVAEAYARAPANSIRYQMKLAVNAQLQCGNNDVLRQRELEYQRKKAREANVLP